MVVHHLRDGRARLGERLDEVGGVALLPRRDEGDGGAFGAGAPRAPHPVHIVLVVVGHVIIDHQHLRQEVKTLLSSFGISRYAGDNPVDTVLVAVGHDVIDHQHLRAGLRQLQVWMVGVQDCAPRAAGLNVSSANPSWVRMSVQCIGYAAGRCSWAATRAAHSAALAFLGLPAGCMCGCSECHVGATSLTAPLLIALACPFVVRMRPHQQR